MNIKGRPSSLTSEQLAEMIKLSATKTKTELAEIYNLDRSTIYHHLEQKPRKNEFVSKRVYKKRIVKKLKREEKINSGKNYIDYLKIENEGRKKQGLYLLKQK